VLNQTQPKGLVHLCSARTPPALPLVEADGAGISLQNPESRALTPPCGKSAERMVHEGVPNTLPEGTRVYIERVESSVHRLARSSPVCTVNLIGGRAETAEPQHRIAVVD